MGINESHDVPVLIGRAEVASRLTFDRLIPAIEKGFNAFHAGSAPISPVTSLLLPEVRGETHIRAGYLTDGEIVCVKVANFYFDNPRIGLPTLDCAVVVSDRRTGRIRAIVCDGGLLSDMRTAAASAVAARALSRVDATSLGLVGAGNQAFWHAVALGHVRGIDRVKVWSRSAERASATAVRITAATGVRAGAASLDEAAACDIVVTATPARSAILDAQPLAARACVIAMGADMSGKRELGPGLMARASWIVADNLAQALRAGESQWLPDAHTDERVTELGAVLSGDARRPARDDLIVYDSTGIAFQDAVAAALLLEAQPGDRARAEATATHSRLS